MLNVFRILFLVALLVTYVYAVDEVTLYQKPVCSGHHYRVTLGHGCKNVPEWLTEEGWNLSIDPHGHCVKVYEVANCRESVAYAFSAVSSNRDDIVKRCRSTKQLGFSTIRSFKRVPGPC